METLEGNETRPTGEKVKEAVFSMIQFEIEGRRVLDVFAGSGQLSFEALSRGAESAVMIDASKDAAAIIRRNAVKTKMLSNSRVIASDYKLALRGLEGQKFQLIFADPPYAAKLIPDTVDRVLRYGLLSDGGIMVCESEESEPYEHPMLTVRKHNKYGRSYITIYEKKSAEIADNGKEVE
ncbi:MAG: 16S rRNA (guanine(966)-N(2))-methyltransferase RsmD [Clostridia bacterium]|nr:16S rRNA (guanine(966)-N(2))-methyltransferase RsmD [Clostridia bacterium]